MKASSIGSWHGMDKWRSLAHIYGHYYFSPLFAGWAGPLFSTPHTFTGECGVTYLGRHLSLGLDLYQEAAEPAHTSDIGYLYANWCFAKFRYIPRQRGLRGAFWACFYHEDEDYRLADGVDA